MAPTAVANLARAYVASGTRSEAIKLLNDLKKRSSPVSSHASEIAVIYAALGDTDQAMNWLEKGYEERFNPGVLLSPASILSARIRAFNTLCVHQPRALNREFEDESEEAAGNDSVVACAVPPEINSSV